MLKIVLVDDEENARESLREQLNLYHREVILCELCNTVSSAVKAIKQYQPNMVLLDVEMGKESGFDIFKHFPEPNFNVIFVTAYEQYALKAFRFAALDYLLKPVDSNLLAEALQRATHVVEKEKLSLRVAHYQQSLKQSNGGSDKIVLKTADTVHLVKISDIMYCKAESSYTMFYLADKSHILISTTMGDYEELLKAHDFFRIHQSYLLNLNYFKQYEKSDGGKAILKDNTSLPVATRKKDQLLQRLASF